MHTRRIVDDETSSAAIPARVLGAALAPCLDWSNGRRRQRLCPYAQISGGMTIRRGVVRWLVRPCSLGTREQGEAEEDGGAGLLMRCEAGSETVGGRSPRVPPGLARRRSAHVWAGPVLSGDTTLPAGRKPSCVAAVLGLFGCHACGVRDAAVESKKAHEAHKDVALAVARHPRLRWLSQPPPPATTLGEDEQYPRGPTCRETVAPSAA